MFFSLLFVILMNNKISFYTTYNSLPQLVEALLGGLTGSLFYNANIDDFFDMESFFWFFNVFSPLGEGADGAAWEYENNCEGRTIKSSFVS